MNRFALTSRPEKTDIPEPLSGSIQIHIDPLWAIAKTFGVSISPQQYIYREVIPFILDLLQKYNLRVTFFVIGRDLMIKENRAIVQAISSRGHEIGNHSFTHPIGFRYLSRKEKETEIARAEILIGDTVGIKPIGFASPAYDIDEITLQLLEERGYLYDSSVYPSYFSFWAKSYRHLKTLCFNRSFHSSVKSNSWGKLSYMFAPRRPYHPSNNTLLRRGTLRILEIPMSSIPFFGMPFYNYFCLFSGNWYFQIGLRMLTAAGREINYLIHPTEFLNPDAVKKYGADLINIPTLDIPYEKKLCFIERALEEITSIYTIVPLKELAKKHESVYY